MKPNLKNTSTTPFFRDLTSLWNALTSLAMQQRWTGNGIVIHSHMLMLPLCSPQQEDSLEPYTAPLWDPSHRRQSSINFSNTVVPKWAFHLVQKAHPHNRVEVSDLLLLNPVPAYTPENRALRVLNSCWYSKQQSVLHPGCYFQVPLRSGSLISRFELSMPFSLRCVATHSSQKKLTWAFSLHGKFCPDNERGHSGI